MSALKSPLAVSNRCWWQSPDIEGLIRCFAPGLWKLVRPEEDMRRYKLEHDEDNNCYKFYDNNNNLMCTEYPDSYFEDNGNGKGYTLYRADGTRVGVGALEIQDKEDGELDVLYGGPLPGPNWTFGPVQLPSPEIQEARRAEKKARRAVVPLSQRMGLYFDPSVIGINLRESLKAIQSWPGSLCGATPGLVMLAGPSAFSPDCAEKYTNLHRQLLEAPHNLDQLGQKSEPPYSEMPPNWNVVVDRHSLARLLASVNFHNPSLYWTSKAGFVYPMLYIPGENCWSWTPRDFTSWVSESEIRQYLNEYEYRPGTVDPRVPEEHWPVDIRRLQMENDPI
ncbi:hypothetical protein F5Y14DRAFT_458600 [Nemania sp. NC0429]|nr:hypothetical protein F5Y14DRAFT_458600 [Nemania sp. NC0429]